MRVLLITPKIVTNLWNSFSYGIKLLIFVLFMPHFNDLSFLVLPIVFVHRLFLGYHPHFMPWLIEQFSQGIHRCLCSFHSGWYCLCSKGSWKLFWTSSLSSRCGRCAHKTNAPALSLSPISKGSGKWNTRFPPGPVPANNGSCRSSSGTKILGKVALFLFKSFILIGHLIKISILFSLITLRLNGGHGTEADHFLFFQFQTLSAMICW